MGFHRNYTFHFFDFKRMNHYFFVIFIIDMKRTRVDFFVIWCIVKNNTEKFVLSECCNERFLKRSCRVYLMQDPAEEVLQIFSDFC